MKKVGDILQSKVFTLIILMIFILSISQSALPNQDEDKNIIKFEWKNETKEKEVKKNSTKLDPLYNCSNILNETSGTYYQSCSNEIIGYNNITYELTTNEIVSLKHIKTKAIINITEKSYTENYDGKRIELLENNTKMCVWFVEVGDINYNEFGCRPHEQKAGVCGCIKLQENTVVDLS